MSSVDDEPERLDSLLQECLAPVLNAQPIRDRGQTVTLKALNEEAFVRQGGGIPERLSELVKEFSGNQYIVLPADPIIADSSVPLSPMAEVYFVRCKPGAVTLERRELVTQVTPDMVLFAINRPRKRLFIDIPIRDQVKIDAEVQKRQEKRDAERRAEAQRSAEMQRFREEADADLSHMFARLERYVEVDGRHSILEEWWRVQRKGSSSFRDVPIGDVVLLCHRLGIDFTHLTTHTAPATP